MKITVTSPSPVVVVVVDFLMISIDPLPPLPPDTVFVISVTGPPPDVVVVEDFLMISIADDW